MPNPPSGNPILLYDGTCGFCAASVQFVLRHERSNVLRFVSLQSGFGKAVLGRHPELVDVDSMMFVLPAAAGRGERVFVRSGAVLRVVSYLHPIWKIALVGSLLPQRLRDALYDVIARHRHRLIHQQCLIPPPKERTRFLENEREATVASSADERARETAPSSATFQQERMP